MDADRKDEKLRQLLEFRSRQRFTNPELEKFFVISEAQRKRWLAGYLEIPDVYITALELYEKGEMPSPSSVIDADGYEIINRIKTDLELTDSELADCTGASEGTVRKWRTGQREIAPAWLIAFAGKVKRKYGYETKLL